MYTMEFCPSEVIKKYYVTVTKEHFRSGTKPRFFMVEFKGNQKHFKPRFKSQKLQNMYLFYSFCTGSTFSKLLKMEPFPDNWSKFIAYFGICPNQLRPTTIFWTFTE